jgi:hypothetical protein
MSNAARPPAPAADSAEVDRNAYNAAFYELGLRWYWDIDTYQNLLGRAGQADSVRVYLRTEQAHLLKAYDADFLVDAIQTRMLQCRPASEARKACYFNWAESCRGELGV